MDLRFSDADEAFRKEVADWLADNLVGEFATLRGRALGWSVKESRAKSPLHLDVIVDHPCRIVGDARGDALAHIARALDRSVFIVGLQQSSGGQ